MGFIFLNFLPACRFAVAPDILPFLASPAFSFCAPNKFKKAAMALPEPLERNGFRVTKKVFTSPQNAASLDPVTKRKITICNLFVNHRLSLADIVRVLDEDYKHVVGVLIEQGFVHERRQNSRESAQAEPKSALFRRRSQ